MKNEADWLIPLRQRGNSGTFNCNFLWQWRNVYVMDNHRLALWCWLRHLDSESKVDLLHMDQHTDCLMSQHNKWVATLPPDIGKLSLQEYLDYPWMGNFGECPLFRYDNYLSLFMERYSEQVGHVYMSTHDDGDNPKFPFIRFSILNCLGYLNARCETYNTNKTILNIDIDYFTETGFEEPIVIVSKEFLRAIGEIIGKGIRNDAIKCLTVALSPESTGSWELSESLAGDLLEAAGIAFSLPSD